MDPDLFLNVALRAAIDARDATFKHPGLKDRLAKLYPQLSKKQLNQYNRLIKTAIHFADDQFTALLRKPGQDPSVEEFQRRVLAAYPWVDSQNLAGLHEWFLWALYRG